ncbi:MAG: leucyl/phenylalanyl-tRNA--protein transferase [Desulfobacteraceae bacterium]|nr:leucyl/phenylalanyl-tRNA--protein transferase [Desulfobacteraceae bacterium]
MSVYKLSSKLEFPPPYLAEPNGLLCIGGDLSTERLLLAYSNGIFPWYSDDEPLLWWSPDPRLVLYPKNIKISRSLNKKIKNHYFKITVDKAFEDVISACSMTRTQNSQETWLVDEMIHAYIKLHKEGFAHSVECWKNDRLAGGLYGISLGGCFFGESMFTYVSDASKIALATLTNHLLNLNFDLIDCQVTTDHLISMGAFEISRKAFLNILEYSLQKPTIAGEWDF